MPASGETPPSSEPSAAGQQPSFLDEFRSAIVTWPLAAPFVALCACWAALFHWMGNSTLGYIPTVSLFGWMNYAYNQLEDDQHCKYIPLIVLGLLWWKRNELQLVPKRPWWPGLLFVASGLVIHLAGYMGQQTRVSIIGFFVGLFGIIGCLYGPALLRSILFPYGLLVFAVPIGTMADTLTYPLRIMVTHISVFLSSDVLGIKVVKDGTQIVGAQGFHYDVAPACSGIRSLTILLALTTIYGFTSFTAWWKRALMVAVALPLAMLGNVIRITGVIITAEAFGHDAGLKFHDWAGFVTFAVAIVSVLALGTWMREDSVLPKTA